MNNDGFVNINLNKAKMISNYKRKDDSGKWVQQDKAVISAEELAEQYSNKKKINKEDKNVI